MTEIQNQMQLKKEAIDLRDFEKLHSETFMYFLREYEKWQQLKKEKNGLENL